MKHLVAIALGANINSTFGTALQTLEESLRLFPGESLAVAERSRWFSTPAFPAGSGPDFVNAAVTVRTDKSPDEVLQAIHRIEKTLGRTRKDRWEPRVCDLDILFCDDMVLPDIRAYSRWQSLDPEHQKTRAPDRLILPHPRLQDRAFVLVPLLDVAPDWRHPVTGLTVAAMADALPDADIAEISVISA